MEQKQTNSHDRKLPAWEKDFILHHLDASGQFLFFQMHPVDQRHALDVAKSVLTKQDYESEISSEPLVQAALLHDIGKVSDELKPLMRLMVGLIKRIAPKWLARSADRNGGVFARACYVDLNHPARGAYMAATFGVSPEVAAIIRTHHEPPKTGEPLILKYIREADKRSVAGLWRH